MVVLHPVIVVEMVQPLINILYDIGYVLYLLLLHVHKELLILTLVLRGLCVLSVEG